MTITASMVLRLAARALYVVFPCALLASCGNASERGQGTDTDAGEQGTCLATLPRADKGQCNAAYEPTFDAIFARTLKTSCAGSRCHDGSFRAGGLTLTESAATAYQGLLDASGGEPALVVASSPECSPLVKRLESKDPLFKMPRLGSIDDDERCAIVQWIASGAKPPSGPPQ